MAIEQGVSEGVVDGVLLDAVVGGPGVEAVGGRGGWVGERVCCGGVVQLGGGGERGGGGSMGTGDGAGAGIRG